MSRQPPKQQDQQDHAPIVAAKGTRSAFDRRERDVNGAEAIAGAIVATAGAGTIADAASRRRARSDRSVRPVSVATQACQSVLRR